MATYIMLGNYTDQGIGKIKDSPKRLEAARVAAKDLGITLKDFYLCMGTYDFAVIAESNSDESVAQFALGLGSLGNVRTMTIHAFTEAQFRKIVGALK